MKAAGFFLRNLGPRIAETHRLVATAYGSLAWTGKGHATDRATPERNHLRSAQCQGNRLHEELWFSIGGGFVERFGAGRVTAQTAALVLELCRRYLVYGERGTISGEA